jgi:hypothetical protein
MMLKTCLTAIAKFAMDGPPAEILDFSALLEQRLKRAAATIAAGEQEQQKRRRLQYS